VTETTAHPYSNQASQVSRPPWHNAPIFQNLNSVVERNGYLTLKTKAIRKWKLKRTISIKKTKSKHSSCHRQIPQNLSHKSNNQTPRQPSSADRNQQRTTKNCCTTEHDPQTRVVSRRQECRADCPHNSTNNHVGRRSRLCQETNVLIAGAARLIFHCRWHLKRDQQDGKG